ncbi:MAG: hypothetical protein KAR20_12535 [Candidatus Heimdallarchaeota archaeon]|nr:hypothetical protein [Candidatus Heimdallarchaeota archaeon]
MATNIKITFSIYVYYIQNDVPLGIISIDSESAFSYYLTVLLLSHWKLEKDIYGNKADDTV